MKHYNNFRNRALLTYKVAIKVYGNRPQIDDLLKGKSYIYDHLTGVVDGLRMAGVISWEDVRIYKQYIEMVVKAYHRNYIVKHFPILK